MKQVGVSLATFVVWAAASSASAAAECSVGIVTANPEAGAISVPFDFFEATLDDPAACNLAVPSGVAPAPGTFSVYSADYRGFVSEGDQVQLTVEQDGLIDRAIVSGPQDGLIFRNYVGDFGTPELNSDIMLALLTAADPDSVAQLDTIDYLLAATTTLDEVEQSLRDIASARTGTMLHLQSTADLLAGGNQPFAGPDELTILGGVGSHLIGLNARYSISPDLTFSGGAGYFDQDLNGANARGVMFTGALRYLPAAPAALRPFAETGVRAAPLSARFTRSYDDGSEDGASAAFSADGLFAGAYLEGGVVLTPDTDNQIVLSATVAHDRLRTDAVSEEFGPDNLFAASFDEETTAVTTVKLGAAWTTILAPDLDLTLNGGVGHGAAGGDLDAGIAFVGAVEVEAQDDSFVDYGARLGFKPAESLKADLFLQGVSAREAGTHVFYGGSLSRQF
ncbi:MAG TPA: hypothetical protein VGN97_14690 [Mesorhizobium sp.]|nr:hypothetical protein [Mesorhizobium sp.]